MELVMKYIDELGYIRTLKRLRVHNKISYKKRMNNEGQDVFIVRCDGSGYGTVRIENLVFYTRKSLIGKRIRIRVEYA